MKTTTWLGNKVDIPDCSICNKWLGKHNCADDDIIYNKGADIVKNTCNHYFHGNCCELLKICPICQKEFKIADSINIHHTDGWIVELFWVNNFSYFLN